MRSASSLDSMRSTSSLSSGFPKTIAAWPLAAGGARLRADRGVSPPCGPPRRGRDSPAVFGQDGPHIAIEINGAPRRLRGRRLVGSRRGSPRRNADHGEQRGGKSEANHRVVRHGGPFAEGLPGGGVGGFDRRDVTAPRFFWRPHPPLHCSGASHYSNNGSGWESLRRQANRQRVVTCRRSHPSRSPNGARPWQKLATLLIRSKTVYTTCEAFPHAGCPDPPVRAPANGQRVSASIDSYALDSHRCPISVFRAGSGWPPLPQWPVDWRSPHLRERRTRCRKPVSSSTPNTRI